MDTKKDLTKELLADCFRELMLTTPFDKITIKMITDRAGLIRPTFYKHFQDKYEVLEWIFERITLFSLLFGIGFGIQLENSGHSTTTFYRRMATLFVIGFLHLMLLWSGDILMLYAAMGMLLPLFRRLPTRRLLAVAGSFLLLPLLAEPFPLRTRRVGLEDDYLPEEAANAARPRLTRSRPSARTLRGLARLMRMKPSVPYMAPAFTHTL